MPPVVPPKQLGIVVTECQSLLDDVSDTPDAACFLHLHYSLVYVVVVVERPHRGPIVREGTFSYNRDPRSSGQVLANEYPCQRLQRVHERLVLLLLLGDERRLVLGEPSADGAGLLGSEVEGEVPRILLDGRPGCVFGVRCTHFLLL